MRGSHRPLWLAPVHSSARVGVVVFVATVSARLSAQSPGAPPSGAAGTPVSASSMSAPASAPVSTAALAASHQEETAMLRWGGVVVWFRATDAGTVLVFASPGYRDPFARPTVLTADEADQWAAIAEQLASAPSNASAPGLAQVAPVSDTARVVLGSGDLVLAPASGTTSAALSVRIGATRADGLSAMVFPDAAPGAAANLRDAARAARRLHATAAAAAAAAAIPAPVPATAIAAATSASPDSMRRSPAASTRPAAAFSCGRGRASADFTEPGRCRDLRVTAGRGPAARHSVARCCGRAGADSAEPGRCSGELRVTPGRCRAARRCGECSTAYRDNSRRCRAP